MMTQHCKNCFIPRNYPGVVIDEAGVCNHCRLFTPVPAGALSRIRQNLEKELAGAASQLRKKKYKYHCAVALSGGKDSSYALWLLAKKYRLKVLAVTVDIGFLQEPTYRNMDALTARLGVDHVYIKEEELFKSVYKYGFSNKFFSKKEGMACSICCRLIPNAVLAYALKKDIPWIVLGNFSLDSPRLFIDPLKFVLFPEKFDPDVFKLFSGQKALYVRKKAPRSSQGLPLFLHPMNTVSDYSAQKIYEGLEANTGIKKELFYSEKTVCMVSMATAYLYQKGRGYNPYAGDVSRQVRSGIIEKDNTALRKTLLMPEAAETKRMAVKTLKSIGILPGGRS